MNPGLNINLIVILISLLFSAFFSGMEIAFFSSNRLQIELDKRRSVFSSKIISVFTSNPSHFITMLLVGNNVALVVYGIFVARILEPVFINYLSIRSDILILTLQTVIGTIVILFTAEFLPKALFRSQPNQALKSLAVPTIVIYVLLYPLAIIFTWITNFILIVFFHVKTRADDKNNVPIFLKADLDHLINENQNVIDVNHNRDPEMKIFQNALEFSHLKVRDCMVPRTEIAAVNIQTPLADLRKKFIETGYSKLLVYQKSHEDIIGYISSKELYKGSESIKSMLVSLSIVPETMPVNKLFRNLIKEQKSMALVVDEYGGTSGIVTLEDIMEEIFGEIEDEYDTPVFIERQVKENEFIFSGRLEIDYLNEKYRLNIPESDEYDTLAGYIIFHYENIPEINTSVRIGNFEIKILKVSMTRIELVHINILPEEK